MMNNNCEWQAFCPSVSGGPLEFATLAGAGQGPVIRQTLEAGTATCSTADMNLRMRHPSPFWCPHPVSGSGCRTRPLPWASFTAGAHLTGMEEEASLKLRGTPSPARDCSEGLLCPEARQCPPATLLVEEEGCVRSRRGARRGCGELQSAMT